MPLSSDQANALEYLKEHRVCQLLGAAGCGKTYVLRTFQEDLGIERGKCMYLGPTHKATTVLQESVGMNAQVRTLASFMGKGFVEHPETFRSMCLPKGSWKYGYWKIRSSQNGTWSRDTKSVPRKVFQDGQVQFTCLDTSGYHVEILDERAEPKDDANLVFCKSDKGTWNYILQRHETKFNLFELLVVDESSMLTKEDFDELLVMAQKNNVLRLIFVGDHAQLPPVKSKLAFPLKGIPKATLTHQHRASGSRLQDAGAYFRRNVLEKILLRIPALCKLEAEGEVEFVAEHPYKDFDAARGDMYLAYRNDTVKVHNQILRKIATKKDEDEPLGKGDWVTARSQGYEILEQASPLTADGFLPLPRVNAVIRNGERYLITGMCPIEIPAVNYYKDQELSVPYWKGIEYHLSGGIRFHVIDHTDLQTKKSVASTMAGVRAQLKKLEPKDEEMRQLLFERLRYIRNLGTCGSPVIQGGLAMTIHKSQGSTFPVVFVDLGDAMVNRDQDEISRLVYVAASRAAEKVVFVF